MLKEVVQLKVDLEKFTVRNSNSNPLLATSAFKLDCTEVNPVVPGNGTPTN